MLVDQLFEGSTTQFDLSLELTQHLSVKQLLIQRFSVPLFTFRQRFGLSLVMTGRFGSDTQHATLVRHGEYGIWQGVNTAKEQSVWILAILIFVVRSKVYLTGVICSMRLQF